MIPITIKISSSINILLLDDYGFLICNLEKLRALPTKSSKLLPNFNYLMNISNI